MTRVVLTGASPIGTRLRARLAADPDADVTDLPSLAGLSDAKVKAAFDGTAVLVDLGNDVDDTRRALDSAAAAGIGHVVLLSSAAVYGSWVNNPTPLTEQAPLRPNPGFELAVRAGERERLAADWRAETAHTGATVAALRPAAGVAEGEADELARAVRAAARLGESDEPPPAQYLHLDDLAAAVEVARRQRLDGAYNVAPDGWMSGHDLQALGARPRLRLAGRIMSRLGGARRRAIRSPETAALAALATHPWVVANDRLRATGWHPEHTNEEAYVAGHRAAPWATISPRRRQELLLGGSALLLVAAGAAAGIALRSRVRARSANSTNSTQ